MSADESMDEIVSRHKKEVKQLEGEKRAALKKAKSLKGKKAKEETASYVQPFGHWIVPPPI
jgi:hypothetical protein